MDEGAGIQSNLMNNYAQYREKCRCERIVLNLTEKNLPNHNHRYNSLLNSAKLLLSMKAKIAPKKMV